jgi:hypothetical protein
MRGFFPASRSPTHRPHPPHISISHIINFAESFPDDVTRSPPLRDVLHESLPNLAHARAAAEALHVTPVLLAGGCMLRAFDQRSLDALRTFLWVHGSLMALRGLCFAVTLLPDASRSCRESPFMGSCHDLVFSGHVLIMTLGSLTARLFFVLPAGFTPILVLSTLGTAAFIAAARNHYTLDVLLSLILTPLVWYVWTTHETCVALAMLDPDKSMVGAGRAFRSRRTGGRPSDDDSSVTSSGNQSTPATPA